MRAGPSKTAEAIVAALVPPACREEVLGDLHERYRSPGQYCLDALGAVPHVIVSRIRRTADAQVLLMQACALYASFLGAAWFEDRPFLTEHWGLLRLAIPVAVAMVGLILEDAYAKPGQRSSSTLARGPSLGLGLALASQAMFRTSNADWALPGWITFYGCAVSLPVSSAIRMLFPPTTGRAQGANAPTDWLKQSTGMLGDPEAGIRAVEGFVEIIAAVIGDARAANRSRIPKPRIAAVLLLLLLVLSIAYQVWQRG
jgi:hypothetical protein